VFAAVCELWLLLWLDPAGNSNGPKWTPLPTNRKPTTPTETPTQITYDELRRTLLARPTAARRSSTAQPEAAADPRESSPAAALGKCQRGGQTGEALTPRSPASQRRAVLQAEAAAAAARDLATSDDPSDKTAAEQAAPDSLPSRAHGPAGPGAQPSRGRRASGAAAGAGGAGREAAQRRTRRSGVGLEGGGGDHQQQQQQQQQQQRQQQQDKDERPGFDAATSAQLIAQFVAGESPSAAALLRQAAAAGGSRRVVLPLCSPGVCGGDTVYVTIQVGGCCWRWWLVG